MYATDHGANGQANGPPDAAVLDADPPVDGSVATGHQPGHDEGGNHVPALIVRVDGQDTELDASALNDPSIAQDLQNAGANTAGTVDFHVADLLAWPAPDRWRLLSLVRSIGAKARIGLGGHPPRADVFGALLDAMVGPENLERCQRGLESGVDAAAVFHPEALPLACAQLAARAKKLKVPGITTAGLLAQARALAAGPGEGSDAGQVPIYVRDELSDSPVAEDALVPPGWSLTDEGVSRADGDAGGPRPVATPLVVAARLKDVGDGGEALRLAWRRDGQWHGRVVERTVTADARGVIRLAELGIQVTSGNAALVVAYLDAYETANRTALPVERVSRQMGWLGPALADGFLWGRTHLVGAGQPADVEYRGLDAGDEQAAAAFHAAGGLAQWRDAVEPLADYPRARLGLYAGLAPPLLAVLGAPNFAVDFAGETSGGKTTLLRAIASEWGDPDEQNPASALGTWDATRTWIERTLAVRSGLPMILDDTKRARRREDVAQTLYDATSGRGRGRGTIRGTDQVLGWHSVLISSGEAPATSFTHDGGTKARVLTLWGSPFGCKDAATGELVQRLDADVKECYGLAGPRLVRHLIDNRIRWPEWREQYRATRQDYHDRAQGDAVVGRMAAHFATLVMAARLAHQANLLPWDDADPVEPLWAELTARAAGADVAAAALRHLLSWAAAHAHEFLGRRKTTDPPPSGGWAGKWSGKEGWDYIGLLPHVLNELLASAGFDAEAVRETWRDRQWVEVATDGKARKKVRWGAGPKDYEWVVAIKRTAVIAVHGAEGQADEDPGDDS